MGCTKVCETALSGIWVLKGNARARMLPNNLDHFRVGWRKLGTRDRLGYARARLSVSVRVWTWSSSLTTNRFIHLGWGLWSRVAPLLSPWCAKEEVPTGVNLNQYAGLGSLSLSIAAHRIRIAQAHSQYEFKLVQEGTCQRG